MTAVDMPSGLPLLRSLPCATVFTIVVLLARIASSHASCTFPAEWTGRWFQSGVQNPLAINRTHIETKGECYEEQDDTKYLVYDKSDSCYRCMAIHSKHEAVLQYKETYCEASANNICYGITGDASLYSMFRTYPEAKPITCPFKGAPFTFSYNRGSGDCANPPSKAESCTDDSRLVLKYQSCPEVASTESIVEELVCLATWKEGSTRYLLSRILQGNRRALTSDEDQYRCFIYQRKDEAGTIVYYMAQSADASCNGVQSAFEGSKTMKFMTVDNHHNRCKFPIWITDHHTWSSLDHKKIFKFSLKNATLNIIDEEPKSNVNRFQHHQNYVPAYGFQQNGFESQDQRRQNSEIRTVCHNILRSQENKVQIVAHVTAGCDSGYVCMMFYKRDNNVIEFQQSQPYEDSPEEACRYFDATVAVHTTLVSHALHPKKCPHRGRFTVLSEFSSTNKASSGVIRKRRQQSGSGGASNVLDGSNHSGGSSSISSSTSNCQQHDYDGFTVGCNGDHELIQFRSATCSKQSLNSYTCLGSWLENHTYYVITAPAYRPVSDAPRYCFIYNIHNGSPKNNAGLHELRSLEGSKNGGAKPFVLRLSSISESCSRDVVPGLTGMWAFNFTSNGTCAEVGGTDLGLVTLPSLLLTIVSGCLITFMR